MKDQLSVPDYVTSMEINHVTMIHMKVKEKNITRDLFTFRGRNHDLVY